MLIGLHILLPDMARFSWFENLSCQVEFEMFKFWRHAEFGPHHHMSAQLGLHLDIQTRCEYTCEGLSLHVKDFSQCLNNSADYRNVTLFKSIFWNRYASQATCCASLYVRTRPSHKNNMSTPGVEPGLSRPQRDVLTTRRCGPCSEVF